MVSSYRKCMSAHPQRAKLRRERLREKVERRANRRVHGDFRITWRFDRRVDDEITSESGSHRAGAPVAHLGDAGGHAEPFEGGNLVLEAARQDTLERSTRSARNRES